MLTGTYPHHHGVLINDEESGRAFHLAPGQRMISHDLLQAGYRNMYFGKWHCGSGTTAQDYGFEG